MPKVHIGENVFLGFADNIRTTVVIFITEGYRNRMAIFVAMAFFGSNLFHREAQFLCLSENRKDLVL